MNRRSGILLSISSLPSPYGIGSLGKEAYDFADFLKETGQQYWQVLPVGPTGIGNSPYSTYSSMAGNPLYIDLTELIEKGFLETKEVEQINWGSNLEKVDYEAVKKNRRTILYSAYKKGFNAEAVDDFTEKNHWVDDYALFMAAKKYFNNIPWFNWPDEKLRQRDKETLEKYKEKLKDEIDFQRFLQYTFYRQWKELSDYIHECGIFIIGDMPIYVARDSADLWCEPEFFQLDEDLVPKAVAGVPPDYFSEDGQLWGNPLYDWEKMKADGYGWWIRRVEGASKLFDVIRIDHFRAFASYWAVPSDAKSAKEGEWRKGPGMDLIGVLTNWFYNVRFIAEDLGVLTPDVTKLLEESGLPGMNVLEFGFSPDACSKYIPYKCVENSITYVGTHDNDTAEGWYEDPDVDEKEKETARDYLGISELEPASLALIRGGMGTASCLFVAQMQDWLALGSEARMNVPGTTINNWEWRMTPDVCDKELKAHIYRYTKLFGRLPEKGVGAF